MCLGYSFAQRNSPNDGSWSKPFEILRFTRQADVMIRVGDIDNLGFGFESAFDPFSGRSTPPHAYPWEPVLSDPQGTDRIFVCSGFKNEPVCGSDGYTNETYKTGNQPKPIQIPLDALKNSRIQSASLQLFLDDFQSPEYCSRFRVWLNGKVRFRELESILREINQTGPIGKLVNVNLPSEYLHLLKEPVLSVLIDDSLNQAGDGFAIDFVKLLINPKVDQNRGNLSGKIISKHTGEPILKANVELIAGSSVISAEDGSFQFNSLTSGYAVLKVSAKGFQTHYQGVDIITAETGELLIELDAPKMLSLEGRLLAEGESMSLGSLAFEQSSAVLMDSAKTELQKLIVLLNQNRSLEIELAGHTSSEGDRLKNVELSLQRVNACKTFLVENGISAERIQTVGLGPDKPILPNTTAENKARNRRVELKILRIQ